MFRENMIQVIRKIEAYSHRRSILGATCQAPSHRGAKRQVIVTIQVLVEEFAPISVDKVGHTPCLED